MPKSYVTREEWANLQYPVTFRKFTPEEGDGYTACIEALGAAGFRSIGETLEEALSNLEEMRLEAYDDVIESGVPIPMPLEEDELPSGRFIVRTSPKLHLELKFEAERMGMSFNALCARCLERGLATETIRQVALEAVNDIRNQAESRDRLRASEEKRELVASEMK